MSKFKSDVKSWKFLDLNCNFEILVLCFEFVAKRRGGTRGNETSEYPEEKKLIKIPLVAVSESGGV